MSERSPFLTTKEVAERWRSRPEAVLNAIWGGQLVATKPAGRWLLKLEDVEAYERAQQNAKPAPLVRKRRRLPQRRVRPPI